MGGGPSESLKKSQKGALLRRFSRDPDKIFTFKGRGISNRLINCLIIMLLDVLPLNLLFLLIKIILLMISSYFLMFDTNKDVCGIDLYCNLMSLRLFNVICHNKKIKLIFFILI